LDLTKAGNILAVGCSNGHVMIYDYNKNLTLKQHIKDRTKPITVVKFCPMTKILAIGGQDCLIILYNISNTYRR
jgi:WD40 repeat protein